MAKRLEESVAGLISINKPHTDNIFIHLQKRIEWRKQPLPLGKYYVYETKRGGGCGKVIGEVRVVEHTRYSAKSKVDLKFIPPVVIELGCLGTDELYKYGSRKSLWANLLNGIKLYDKPKELGEFKTICKVPKRTPCSGCGLASLYMDHCERPPITRPPQSWCRVQEIKE